MGLSEFQKKGCMHMRRFEARGGYGEHGRSCFLVEYGTEHHYYMVDCGIMDSDPSPYPVVTSNELERVDYLFLTHCHKDHSGALDEWIRLGWHGTLVTSRMTVQLAKIRYDHILYLPEPLPGETQIFSNRETKTYLNVRYGRTGHCPGGLWFWIQDEQGSCFFSGDYQKHALAYAADPITGFYADLAILDCAHRDLHEHADELRNRMKETIRSFLQDGRKVILPLPHYGRGAEILLLLEELKKEVSELNIGADSGFVKDLQSILTENIWYQNSAYLELNHLCHALSENSDLKHDQILLLGDTHLQKKDNQELVLNEIQKGAALIISGRVKHGNLPETLLKEGLAVKCLYPHHQSEGDFEQMIQENHFQVVLPFHNSRKEVWFHPTTQYTPHT